MDRNLTALSLEEVSTAKAAIRVIRYLTGLALFVAAPLAVVLFTPIVGWALLVAILGSPLFFLYALAAARNQEERERATAR